MPMYPRAVPRPADVGKTVRDLYPRARNPFPSWTIDVNQEDSEEYGVIVRLWDDAIDAKSQRCIASIEIPDTDAARFVSSFGAFVDRVTVPVRHIRLEE